VPFGATVQRSPILIWFQSPRHNYPNLQFRCAVFGIMCFGCALFGTMCDCSGACDHDAAKHNLPHTYPLLTQFIQARKLIGQKDRAVKWKGWDRGGGSGFTLEVQHRSHGLTKHARNLPENLPTHLIHCITALVSSLILRASSQASAACSTNSVGLSHSLVSGPSRL